MANVSLQQVGKSYGKSVAVEAFNLDIRDGEFLVLLGPSGCGKSTTLRMIAGLESITTGDLLIGGERMNEVDPKNRGVAMVFQNYALYPHKTVEENMGMALKLQKMPKAEISERVAGVADMLGLTEYLERKPGSLSGGQRQRVAIGRAIVRTPQVFLFDEPLSNLDAKLRVKMRMELQELHDRLGVTSVYVTHDQVEAMTLADRIVVMDGGVIAQVGSPREVYDTPATEFVAGFIGSPAMNFISVERASNGEWASMDSDLRLPELPGIDLSRFQHVKVGIRPEHLTILEPGEGVGDPWVLSAKVVLAELLGADALLSLSVQGELITARVNGVDYPEQGQELRLRLNPDQLHVFDSETRKALPRIKGTTV
ncbi:ABC transporter ATP-binding protein [Granulosicoccus antarcticus]|uniref:sn-glycerol-3-phosphate import ATP-binding protein UgpC n=1 Tax=Granulosicoccus antarcticus IMCC3135 TaxID=1192854 RepID=A0A2Z2NWN0_9GAMM|nr:sn-glycerol-3-phosphate ABC transporter ATP-binding protein UgpC [Granulosicoccus antarcticus]ASJ71564.1 sn-glycerol-3-phosphate import ATP-binding protein UgpC [Granulosicoccus antarcticus IMCC3135]